MKGDSLVSSTVTTKDVRVDYEFFKTFDIPIAAGRDFSKDITTDDTLAFIVNEAAAKAYGWKTPAEGVGKDFAYGGTTGKLVGVVKDFHFESLHQEIVPLVFYPSKGGYRRMAVSISGKNMEEGMAHLEKLWHEFLPKRPFDYEFLSERYQQLYASEQKQSQLFTIFAGLAIFIACMGLFGLAAFNTMQRVKEIGIRKVLGRFRAEHPGIVVERDRGTHRGCQCDGVACGLVLHAKMVGHLCLPHRHEFARLLPDGRVGHCAGTHHRISMQTIKAATSNPTQTLRYE